MQCIKSKRTTSKLKGEIKMKTLTKLNRCVEVVTRKYYEGYHEPTRDTKFCNSVAELAYTRYNINVADETSVQNDFCVALDNYFTQKK